MLIKRFSSIAIALSACIYADAPAEPQADDMDIGKISEAFGHLISKNIQTTGIRFDIAQVIKGLQDASTGKESPMSDVECLQAITAVQDQLMQEQSTGNLKKAQEFLEANAEHGDVICLEEGKVQYRIDHEGEGPAVETHFSPLIHYTGKLIDGTVFSASKEDEMMPLDEIIPGLKAGLVGMREGEKRTIFIHPDLAYGSAGYLPPNSLLTFEIELVKANASINESPEMPLLEMAPPAAEIAQPETHIR